MEKEFIPYQQALDLKELGFDEPCIKYYWTDGMFVNGYENPFNYNKRDNVISCPTFSQTFRWFREKYQLSAQPHYVGGDWKWYGIIVHNLKTGEQIEDAPLVIKTYEEAELASLNKLIEIVKEKK